MSSKWVRHLWRLRRSCRWRTGKPSAGREERECDHRTSFRDGRRCRCGGGTMEVAEKDAIMPESIEVQKRVMLTLNVPSRKALATPVARAMAKEMGININNVPGSGPSGRVKSEDILNFKPNTGSCSHPARQATAAEDVTYLPLTQIRKAIARN